MTATPEFDERNRTPLKMMPEFDQVRLAAEAPAPPPVQFLPSNARQDQTVRYRCDHLMEQLGMGGGRTSLNVLLDRGTIPLTGDVIVLHRASYQDDVPQIMATARTHGKALVYSADDLMITDDLPRKGILHFEPAVDAAGYEAFLRAQAEWVLMSGHAASQRETLARCDCAVVSTDYLADRVREQGKPAYVVRNAMSQEMARLSQKVRRDRSLVGGRVVLGYLSGSASHNHDFGEIAEVLASLMHRRTNVYLTVVGPMRVPECLRGFGTRLRRLPLVPWQDLPSLIADLDVNLAPLDMLQPFNHAKSEIKWMEAGAVGVPTVASATRGFLEAVRPGEDGLLVETAEEWAQALESLVTQPDLRQRLGEAARREVAARYTAEVRSRETLAVFAEIASRYAHPTEGAAPSLAGPAPAAAATVAAGPGRSLPRRAAGLARRGAIQTALNWRRAVSPFYWGRVLDVWERR